MLSCDPIFNSDGKTKEATWYKDGTKIAEVTGYVSAEFAMFLI